MVLRNDYIAGEPLPADDVNDIVDAAKKNYEAGDVELVASDAEVFSLNPTYTKVKEIEVGKVYGEFRISFQLKIDGTGTVYGRIYKNGSPVGTERSTISSTYQTYSEDLSDFVAGDLIQLYIKVI